jgi:hypothetical protein
VVTRRRVGVHILFKIPSAQLWVVWFLKNYELFVFLLIFRCCFMGPNFWGKQVSFQKKCQAHSSASAA